MSTAIVERTEARARRRPTGFGLGLHRHPIEGNLLRGSLAETVGTFI